MTKNETRSPLIAEEDWWTVWFGLIILLLATVLGILSLSGQLSAVKVPKLGKWVSNPADVLYRAKSTKIDLDEMVIIALL